MATQQQRKKYVPQPHVVDGRRYRLIDDPARAYVHRPGDGGAATLASPHAPANVGRVVALHEEGHVRWTPPDVTPASVAAALADTMPADLASVCQHPAMGHVVNLIEDTRVNHLLRYYVGIRPCDWEPVLEYYSVSARDIRARIVQADGRRDGFGIAAHALTILVTPVDYPHLLRLRRAIMPRAASEPACALLHEVYAAYMDLLRGLTWEGVMKAARCIAEAVHRYDHTFAADAAVAAVRAVPVPGGLPDSLRDAAVRDARGEHSAVPGGTRTDWGAMRVVMPPRPCAQRPQSVVATRKRAADSGTVLRFPHRWSVDRAVFAASRRGYGGTVLVDVSGSMRLAIDDIEQLLRWSPTATVAMYSGSKRSGTLYVLAASRRRVAAIPSHTQGNIIDGPALRWLVGQPEPRLWISDGYVTGCLDRPASHLTREAFGIARAGRVVRVPDVATAVRLFAAPAALRTYIRSRFAAV